MRHVLVTYTVRFNRKHDRSGHLFQGRFKSLLIEEDEYLLPLSRYIHLNPLRTEGFKGKEAKVREAYLRKYPWSSFPGYWSTPKRVKWVDYEWLLKAYFGEDDPGGRAQYRAYVYAGIAGDIRSPFDDVVHQSILGKPGFVERTKGRITPKPEREIPSLRKLRRSIPTEVLLKALGDLYGVAPEEILKRTGRVTWIRQAAMELCYRCCPVGQREVGVLFGVDYSTVSQNRRRFKERMKADRGLKNEFEELERKLGDLSNQKI